MVTPTGILAVLVVLGSGITAGVLFAMALSVTPALIAMSPPAYVDAHKLLGRRWDPTMPIIVLTTAVLAVVLVVMVPNNGARALYVIGAVLLFGVSAVSHLANVPINKRVKGLSSNDIPDDWDDPRKVWRNWNLLRFALAMLALLVNALALGSIG